MGIRMTAFDDHLLYLALQGSAEPMLIVDGEHQLRWANLAAHQSPEDVISLPLSDYLASATLTAQYFDAQSCQHFLRQLTRLPFGEVRWFHQNSSSEHHVSVLLIRWRLLAERSDRYCLITFQDRGRRRSDPGPAEAALKNQQLFINQLIHELRTPLAITSGSMRRASKKISSLDATSASVSAGEHLHVAKQELKRITRLIDHLTLLTDIDAGSQRWRMQPVSVGRLLEHWFDELPNEARHSLMIAVDSECEHHYLKLDLEAAKIVLDNLFDNACRYGSDGAVVLIYAGVTKLGVSLYVADWGSGVPLDLRDQVFDRFRRLEHHRDPARADGSGLGLAVTKALLNQMNADISLLPILNECIEGVPSTVFEVCFKDHGLVHPEDRKQFDAECSRDPQMTCLLIDQLKNYLTSLGLR